MKIGRYGPAGEEKPCILDAEGVVRDISSLVGDIRAADFSPAYFQAIRSVDVERLPVVEAVGRFGVPLTGISKVICIGLNYSDHAAEAGMAIPTEPIIFLKAVSALCGPNDDTIQPPHSTKLDWEVELGVVIGREARFVSEADARDHVAGYCVVNDVSERAFQMQCSQWDKGKGCDTFGPIGPWLVTADEVTDPQTLDMWLDVNGTRMQAGNTRTMIFGVDAIIAYCSRYMTLMPGDVIATGTPPGVGMGIKPDPVFLKAGDVVSLGIAGLGEQRQTIVPSPIQI